MRKRTLLDGRALVQVDNSRLFTKTLHLAGAPAAAALNKALTDDKALAALVNGKWRGAYAALSENTRERVSGNDCDCRAMRTSTDAALQRFMARAAA